MNRAILYAMKPESILQWGVQKEQVLPTTQLYHLYDMTKQQLHCSSQRFPADHLEHEHSLNTIYIYFIFISFNMHQRFRQFNQHRKKKTCAIVIISIFTGER